MQTLLNNEERAYILDEARYGELELLKQLFSEISPDLISQIKDEQNNTLLHMAAGNGHTDCLKLILSSANVVEPDLLKWVNTQNESGNTALHWAALNGHLGCVKVLCDDYNADIFVKNGSGHDAVFCAENDAREDVSEYFLQKYEFDPEKGVEQEEETEEPTFTEGKEIEQLTKEALAVRLEDEEKQNEEKKSSV